MITELFRILHLSDLHFGTAFFLHNDKARADPEEWAVNLADNLERGLVRNQILDRSRQERGLRQFDLLVVSGDLTCYSQPIGMQAAECFFAEIEGSGEKKGRWWSAADVLLLPGNHDMFFGDKPEDIEPPVLLLKVPNEKRTALFRSTYRNITGIPLENGEWLGLLKAYPERRLAILGLDSCRLESWAAPGIGFVGLDQVKVLGDAALLAQMKAMNEPVLRNVDLRCWHRLAFLHHHVTGMTQVTGSSMRDFVMKKNLTQTWDAEAVIEGLQEYGIDFILHGHYHQPNIRNMTNSATHYGRVLSAGSAGVQRQLCSNLHHFFVLEIKDVGECRRQMEIKSFELELNDGQTGEWAVKNHKTYDFTQSAAIIMEPETVKGLTAKANLARSAYRTYESWPLAVRFLTRREDRDWGFYLAQVSNGFEEIWTIKRRQDPTLPEFHKALSLLMRRVQSNGHQLLQEFSDQLDGESPRALAAFLTAKIAADSDLRKRL
jgi:3',5'-cyclic AMP phosphodiesterase CpdA